VCFSTCHALVSDWSPCVLVAVICTRCPPDRAPSEIRAFGISSAIFFHEEYFPKWKVITDSDNWRCDDDAITDVLSPLFDGVSISSSKDQCAHALPLPNDSHLRMSLAHKARKDF
jgi:hypothetical protein